MQQVDATKPGAVAVTSDGVLMANDGSDYDSKADYFLELTSNIFFLVASILYVWLSAIDVGYAVEYHEALRNGELQYYMLYWNQMPPQAHGAASVLGYDKKTWDSGGYVEEVDVWWDCLPEKMVKAAEVLGYTQSKWDGGPAPVPLVCDTLASNATSAVDFNSTDVNANLTADGSPLWTDLSPEERQAASVLGYDQTMWNTGETPPEIAIWYDCLKSDQIVAAAILGYDRAVWDGGYEPPPQLDCAVNPAATWAPTMEPVPVPAPAARYLEGEGEGIDEGEGEGVGAVTASPSTYEDDFGEEDRYRLIYIFAAWFFVLTGLIEWWFLGEWYPLVFVAAGVFGFVSALNVLSNVFYSNIFNCVSINCFFIEAQLKMLE